MGDPSPSGKTFDFKLLPPRLQLQLWTLGLSADTSHVGITFRPNQFVTHLDYDYGGAITASRATAMGGTIAVGFNPSKTEGSLVYRGYNFNVSATGSASRQGFSLGFGKAPLPAPDAMQTTFDQAWAGFGRIYSDRGSAPRNPLQFVQTHAKDFSAVSQAASVAQRINSLDPKSNNAGVNFQSSNAPRNAPLDSSAPGLTIMSYQGFCEVEILSDVWWARSMDDTLRACVQGMREAV
jgi:hypothetical protein